MFLSVLPPLKCISTPCFLHIFFRLSPIPSTYGTTIQHLVWCVLLGVFFFSLFWCFWKIFCMPHPGYLHAPSTCSRCWSSCLANSGVELMVCALCVRVLMTLYLAAISCALSHGRYRSVWVGFLYTPIVKLPSSSGLVTVSRKGMEPSSFASSTVNCDGIIYCVDVLEELLLMFLLLYNPSIINISSPYSRGVQCCCYSLLFKGLHKNVGNYGTNGWPHCCSLVLFIEDVLEHKVGVIKAEGQEF